MKIVKLVIAAAITLLLCSSVFASWVNLGGPNGGTVYNLYRASDGYLYASTRDAGLFMSSDNGATWSRTGIPGDGFYLKISESPSGRLFTAAFSSTSYWSDDHFETSNLLTLPAGILKVDVIHAIDNDNLILVGRNPNISIFKSTDGGANWSTVGTMGLANPGRIVVGTDGTLFIPGLLTSVFMRSTDNGDNWTEVTPGTPAALQYLECTDEGTLVGGYFGSIYRSTDNGDNWTEVHTAMVTNGIQGMAAADDGTLYAVTLAPEVLTSTDDGATWSSSTPDLPAIYDSHCLETTVNGDLVLGVFNKAIKMSSDGGSTWAPSNSGLTASLIGGLAVTADGTVIAAADSFGIYQLPSGTTAWEQIDEITCTGADLDAIRTPDGTLYAGATNYLYKSTDNGANWTEYNTGLVGSNGCRFGTSPSSDLFLIHAQYGIFHSTDAGGSFTQLSGVTAPYVAFGDAQGAIYGGGLTGFYRSDDNGGTFTSLVGGAHDEAAIDFTNDIVYLDSDGSISALQKSTDHGDTWTTITDGLVENGVLATIGTNKIGVDNAGNLFVDFTINRFMEGVVTRSIYVSEDQGATWREDIAGLNSTKAYSFAAGGDGDFYMGTNGEVYCFDPTNDITDTEAGQAFDYTLSQNYPNPFNPTTSIAFTLPQASHVEITVFNLVGQQVASITNQHFSAGQHNVQFDASLLPSGVYFYRLNSDLGMQVKKMLLVK